ncbi:PREDICTED: basic proline-rich protein-like [Calidris pugnax]|uniref:basic proline-rich protein-like n=1 Tax=Calidris pugnax TaxID=198806 RepID=UPI00071D7BEA|nr:PREDICTED: basic proline-rich protein-like [Calidris pugnax]
MAMAARPRHPRGVRPLPLPATGTERAGTGQRREPPPAQPRCAEEPGAGAAGAHPPRQPGGSLVRGLGSRPLARAERKAAPGILGVPTVKVRPGPALPGEGARPRLRPQPGEVPASPAGPCERCLPPPANRTPDTSSDTCLFFPKTSREEPRATRAEELRPPSAEPRQLPPDAASPRPPETATQAPPPPPPRRHRPAQPRCAEEPGAGAAGAHPPRQPGGSLVRGLGSRPLARAERKAAPGILGVPTVKVRPGPALPGEGARPRLRPQPGEVPASPAGPCERCLPPPANRTPDTSSDTCLFFPKTSREEPRATRAEELRPPSAEPRQLPPDAASPRPPETATQAPPPPPPRRHRPGTEAPTDNRLLGNGSLQQRPGQDRRWGSEGPGGQARVPRTGEDRRPSSLGGGGPTPATPWPGPRQGAGTPIWGQGSCGGKGPAGWGRSATDKEAEERNGKNGKVICVTSVRRRPLSRNRSISYFDTTSPEREGGGRRVGGLVGGCTTPGSASIPRPRYSTAPPSPPVPPPHAPPGN